MSEDLPLCDRFRARRPRAFSEEKSWSRVQRDVCESGSKLAGSCSTASREEDEKKRKKVMLIVIRFTKVSLYQGHANSQLRQNDGSDWFLLPHRNPRNLIDRLLSVRPLQECRSCPGIGQKFMSVGRRSKPLSATRSRRVSAIGISRVTATRRNKRTNQPHRTARIIFGLRYREIRRAWRV